MSGRPPHDALARSRGALLAARLQEARVQGRLTREQLSAAAGVSTRALVRLELEGTADPGFFTVAALAEALGLSLDDLAGDARRAPVTGLVSVGYEGRTLEQFVCQLLDADVAAVTDVRLTPLSRKPGFSKTRLGQALAEAGIGYRHAKALGNPKINREPFRAGRLAEAREGFRAVLTAPEAQSELGELAHAAGRERVAVLCFERDEQRCHRQVVLAAVRDRTGLPITALA
jgi:transcriptional regulator with XRE-family HTH domain